MKMIIVSFILNVLFSLAAYAQNQAHSEIRDVEERFDVITKRMPKRKVISLMRKISDYHQQLQNGDASWEKKSQEKKVQRVIEQAELLVVRYVVNLSIEKKLLHMFINFLHQEKCACWSQVEKYLDVFKKAQIGNRPEWHFYQAIYKKIMNDEEISTAEYRYLLERGALVEEILEKLDQELEPIKEKEKIPTYKL
ncbi:MAG: hypothetical protein KBD63_03220 [Bacteriovoracaceae bacterium]|nr:hypothetical protein [Bacteriovoracaceae bacterium]